MLTRLMSARAGSCKIDDLEGVRAERLLSLRRSRAGYTGQLTRLYREARELMKETNSEVFEEVRQKQFQINEVFRSFQDCCHRIESNLPEDQSDEKVKAREIYDKEHRGKLEVCGEIEIWLGSNISEIYPELIQPDDSVSQVGSRSGSSASSSSSAKLKAKATQLVAEMKLMQLQEEQALEAQLTDLKNKMAYLKARHEVDKASAELQIYEEEEAISQRSDSKARPRLSQPDAFKVQEEESKPAIHEMKNAAPVNHHRAAGNGFYNTPTIKSYPVQHEVPQFLLQQQMIQTMTNALFLPKPELTPFNGNPLDYWRFIRSFEKNIESKSSSESEKLNYLIQYCSGKAKEVIKNCAIMHEDQGYKAARKMLKERFGDPYTIACASIDKVTKGPALKPSDREGLLQLADKLNDCQLTLSAIGYLDDINSADNLRKIAEQFPFHLKGKWLERARAIREMGGRPNIEDLASFINQAARAANDPVFGQIMEIAKEKVMKKSPSRGTGTAVKSAFAVQANDNFKKSETSPAVKPSANKPRRSESMNSKCLACNGDHYLSKCEEFKGKCYDERHKFLRQKRLCDNCLKVGHIAVRCYEKPLCQVDGCSIKHHTLLHPPVVEKGRENSGTSVNPNAVQTKEDVFFSKGVCLPIVPIRVCSKHQPSVVVVTYALLDKGSDTSLCERRLAEKLGLKGVNHSFSLNTVEKTNSIKHGQVVEMRVMPLNEDDEVELPAVLTVDKLPVSTKSIAKDEDVKKWPHLDGVQVPKIDSEVMLLIGADAPEVFWVQEERRGRRKEPYAVRSLLGWTVMGPTGCDQDQNGVSAHFISSADPLQSQLEKFWQSDFNDGVTDLSVAKSVEDCRALDEMERTVVRVQGHYQMGLPWKHENPYLPNNRYLAETRLKLLKRRFLKDAKLFQMYKKSMNEYLEKGYARKVPEEELSQPASSDRLWYLPHHPVVNPNKPGKVRVVFDCAAKYKGTSLNDQLLQGPDLTNSLFGVLNRFRQEPVALMADIEGMFNQVRVDPKDCDALRFLWWPDDDMDKEPTEMQMLVHLFGVTSSPSCANFSLRKTAEDNNEEFGENIVETVKRNFYVDDCLKSVPSVPEAISLSSDLRKMLQRGGFRLTKWISNKQEVLAEIPDSEKAQSVKDLSFDEFPIERALGVLWDVRTDTLGFKIAARERPPTRRGMLSVTSSVYDPLGLAAPFILPAKRLMQDLCREGLGWDDPIPEEGLTRWKKWLSDLPKLQKVKIDRCIKPPEFGEIVTSQLHTFADASMIGYGAVSYLRLVNVRGEVRCVFVAGKSRLAPVKSVTIPRLELSAAVLAVRLDTILRKELDLKIQESFFWTDSTSVLQYIRNTRRRFQVYVANRVAVIHEASVPSQWRYVDSELNPADDASRGLTGDQMVENVRWLNGPEFLRKDKESWPAQPTNLPELTEQDDGVKKEVQAYAVNTQISKTGEVVDHVGKFINKFSTWYRLKKAVAWLLRFKTYMICKYSHKDKTRVVKNGNLEVKEIQDAEKEIIKYVQKNSFKDEISRLKRDATVKKSSALIKLNPVLQGGIIRVGGRLIHASIDEDSKHPTILPKSHHITDLIVRYYHEGSAHSGREHVLSLLRRKFWIIKARSIVRRALNNCFKCRRCRARPIQQMMADLPLDRITPEKPPFTNVGVDCFGPFLVKRGRRQEKRYGCLFTCLVTRAVHIEVLHSLETDSFIGALHRFISRRGRPELIRSDNGTNFRGSQQELHEELKKWNQDKIEDFLRQNEVSWKFNPPTGSNFGGVWERMIRSVRSVLNILLKQQPVHDETLLTLMTQVEGILNSRPLTKSSDDPLDSEALTPNHLLLMRSNSSMPPGVFTKEDSMVRRWKQSQYLADQFWKRWIKEYLPRLQERQRWTKDKKNVAVGDLVLVMDERSPSGQWPLARITQVHLGRDGLVRSAEIKTKDGVLVRPVNKLCLLENTC